MIYPTAYITCLFFSSVTNMCTKIAWSQSVIITPRRTVFCWYTVVVIFQPPENASMIDLIPCSLLPTISMAALDHCWNQWKYSFDMKTCLEGNAISSDILQITGSSRGQTFHCYNAILPSTIADSFFPGYHLLGIDDDKNLQRIEANSDLSIYSMSLKGHTTCRLYKKIVLRECYLKQYYCEL